VTPPMLGVASPESKKGVFFTIFTFSKVKKHNVDDDFIIYFIKIKYVDDHFTL